MTALKDSIIAEALRLGFSSAGVTTPEPPPNLLFFRKWLENGRHGEMRYLETERAIERRSDPAKILPGCRSILVLSLPHDAPPPLNNLRGRQGQIAAYAWGQDYHEVARDRVARLVEFIEQRAGKPVTHRWYTDTGPILERDLAQRAGLGWAGKNTCLIHPKQGSYFFLVEIFLDLPIPADQPFAADHCGSCTRCIDACPTACILPDRELDATRCISYLTIELKGPIPLDLRAPIGNWIFGCDICQQVCPWNVRFAPDSGDPALGKRPETEAPDLVEELSLTPEAFNLKFRGSPVKRAKRRGYLRNVAVALGNCGDPEAVPALHRTMLEEQEPLVRSHAAWALGRIGGTAAREALERSLDLEKDPAVAKEIRAAMDAARG